MKKYFTLLAGIAILLIGCDHDEPTTIPDPGNLTLSFQNTVNEAALSMLAANYTNASNETYTVNELKYIISNMVILPIQLQSN